MDDFSLTNTKCSCSAQMLCIHNACKLTGWCTKFTCWQTNLCALSTAINLFLTGAVWLKALLWRYLHIFNLCSFFVYKHSILDILHRMLMWYDTKSMQCLHNDEYPVFSVLTVVVTQHNTHTVIFFLYWTYSKRNQSCTVYPWNIHSWAKLTSVQLNEVYLWNNMPQE